MSKKMSPMEEKVVAALSRTDKAAEAFIGRAVYALFERQTREEQNADMTVHQNGVGFSGCDAEILSSFAKFWKKTGFLTPKQSAIARKKLGKYRKQLAEIALERAAVKEAPAIETESYYCEDEADEMGN
jgi:hypothetical protein